MKNYTFTIEGNQESRTGNPLPYLRRTQGSLWTPQAKRYDAWVQFLRQECGRLLKITPHFSTSAIGGKRINVVYLHPFRLEVMQEAHMALTIHFASENHADPDNIFKGFADALFFNDKHLTGSFTFVHAPNKRGRVEVNITLMDVEARSTLATGKGKQRLSRALK